MRKKLIALMIIVLILAVGCARKPVEKVPKEQIEPDEDTALSDDIRELDEERPDLGELENLDLEISEETFE